MTSISPISPVRSTRRPRATASAAANGAGSVAAATATRFTPTPRAAKGMSVQERFNTLEARFLPDKAKGVNVRFQFNLSGSGGGQWYAEIKSGKITVKKGTGPNPTATLSASASDYKKIADGEMNKMWAFMRGKLKVEGDREALKKWDTYFKD